MSNNSRISTLVLGSQVVTTTGNNLYVNGVQVSSTINLSSVVTGISVTGNIGITGLTTITGLGNVIVSQSGNVIQISGLSLTTGGILPFAAGFVNINSGVFNSQFIQFSQNFNATPNVIGSIINNSGDQIIAHSISGVSNSGFYLNLSDSLNTNNYFFDYLATTGVGLYGFALSLISALNNVISNVTKTGGGTDGYIPKFSKDGNGIINSIASGDTTGIYINGNLSFSSAIMSNSTFRIKSGQMQFFDLPAWSGDNTKPWRALGVYSGATIWSDPISD